MLLWKGKIIKNSNTFINFNLTNFKKKVLSYFDPYKYYEFWEKTKLQNYELHKNSKSFESHQATSPNGIKNVSNTMIKKNYQPEKSHTDDFINMKSNGQKDFNNNNYGAAKVYPKAIRRQEFAVGFSNNNILNETSHSYRKVAFNHPQQQQQFQQISSSFYPHESHLKRYQSAKIYNGFNN